MSRIDRCRRWLFGIGTAGILLALHGDHQAMAQAKSAPSKSAISKSATSKSATKDAGQTVTSEANQRLNQYFAQQVERLAASNRTELEQANAANWPEVQARWRQELREMLGLDPLPEKTDLNAVVVERITHGDVIIEKLHYQSRPGLYVTANLYLPTSAKPEGGWPAVLYVCGHSRVEVNGRLAGNKTGYQHHGLWFARHGVVCLTIDTVQLGEMMGEHHGTYRLGRWDWISRGYTPAGVEAWNSIRGLDYLESRPEVDAKRMGITGRSGGGAYSWFTAALDDRIKVAVPVAGITDLEDHVVGGCVSGHCDCMYFVNYYGWDYGRLAALIAPRPLLLANSDHDTIFPLGGVMRIHGQLVDLYERLQAPDAFRVLITPGPHQDTQELQVGAFRWLLKHLQGQDVIVDQPAVKELEPKELMVFPGDRPGDEHVTDVSDWFCRVAEGKVSDAEAVKVWQTRWRPALMAKSLRATFAVPSADGPASSQVKPVKAGKREDGRAWELSEVATDPATKVQALRIAASDSAGSKRVFITLANESIWASACSACGIEIGKTESGDRKSDEDAAWNKLKSQVGTAELIIVAPRGVGASRWQADAKQEIQIRRRFYLLGQTLESMQVLDCLRVMDAMGVGKEDGVKVIAAGSGKEAVLMAVASLLSDQIDRSEVLDPDLNWATGAIIPGILQTCTVEDLVKVASLKSE